MDKISVRKMAEVQNGRNALVDTPKKGALGLINDLLL